MPTNANIPAFPIPSALVDFILLGPADDRRQLQDSPILGDVWLAYAADPAGIQDLLITPHKAATAGHVAREISARLAQSGRANKPIKRSQIAYLQGIVAARLYLDEMLRMVVPITLWWTERKIPQTLEKKYGRSALRLRIKALFDSALGGEPPRRASRSRRKPPPAGDDNFSALDRYLALAGIILWASTLTKKGRGKTEPPSMDQVLRTIAPKIDEIVDGLVKLYEQIDGSEGVREQTPLIFQVSLNRRVMAALDRSVPAVKADAARTLFRVESKKIAWAVLDSGIDRNHTAFQDAEGKPRVKRTFDFTRVRELLSSDNDEIDDARLRELLDGVGVGKADARRRLRQLREDAENRRPINWDVVEELLTLDTPPQPTSVHGTHVAGIIGARKPDENASYSDGMCPDIQLYDFRVLAKTLEDTEFAIIAALQYIRYVNERHSYITIHGVNLSLSIPHNVRNYACGRTPICNECQRLVESGVVVVAAAGNRGYQRFETKEGLFENYAAFSITDPGNAEDVITVGATHGNWPHTYGVSFFSSRGPTGDGRLKPDLVAPGERIEAPIPGNESGAESGTSMAAPHVSGAAAMLMARYAELIGNPRRIKRILCECATDLGLERSFQGHGMLDVLRAFQSI
jgi:serine protease AprX